MSYRHNGAAPLGHRHPLRHSNKGGRHRHSSSRGFGGSNPHPDDVDSQAMGLGGTQAHPDAAGDGQAFGGAGGMPQSGGAGGDADTDAAAGMGMGGMSLGLGGS